MLHCAQCGHVQYCPDLRPSSPCRSLAFLSPAITMVAKDGGPQSVASAITYARRYGVMLACGIAPGDNSDDDGNAAQGVAVKPAAGAGGPT